VPYPSLARTDLTHSQGLDQNLLGERLPGSRRVTSYEILFLPDLLSLGLYLSGPELRFAITRASHVSFQRFCATTMLPKYMLMERFSLAIWNRNKWIVAIVATIWLTNVLLLLIGKFYPVSPSY
jgi:hypothetical protein